jgi:hypothetical protein
MKIRTHRLAWAVFFLFAGAFLLLNNLKVFREFGDGIWGGLFAVVGLGFLIWFLIDRQRTWRAIAGFPLLTIGVLLLLDWRGINLGVWQAALVMFGVALGFWTVLLSGDDTWWALIPAGVLTLMGVLTARAWSRARSCSKPSTARCAAPTCICITATWRACPTR